ncbi:hypothetical protein PLO_1886 [Pediococcus acidilactici NGRI 0510Q]|nr:hypothetical protein PLO_1886 [Pediococcus acidilactici NGRI 0510Q]
MNETLNRWIKKFKHWINPRDPYQNEFVEETCIGGGGPLNDGIGA